MRRAWTWRQDGPSAVLVSPWGDDSARVPGEVGEAACEALNAADRFSAQRKYTKAAGLYAAVQGLDGYEEISETA